MGDDTPVEYIVKIEKVIRTKAVDGDYHREETVSVFEQRVLGLDVQGVICAINNLEKKS